MNKKIILISLIILLPFLIFGALNYKKIKDSESSFPETSFIYSDLEIHTPYAFETASSSKTAAAFMKIKNPNDKEDKLIETWSDIAEYTEIHQNLIDPDDGKMMMRKIKELNIPEKKTALLEPKGYHIMFINLKKPLRKGDTFPLTLTFENSGEQIVNVTVVSPGTVPHTSR